jgi:hypothetical protein
LLVNALEGFYCGAQFRVGHEDCITHAHRERSER